MPMVDGSGFSLLGSAAGITAQRNDSAYNRREEMVNALAAMLSNEQVNRLRPHYVTDSGLTSPGDRAKIAARTYLGPEYGVDLAMGSYTSYDPEIEKAKQKVARQFNPMAGQMGDYVRGRGNFAPARANRQFYGGAGGW